VKLAQLADGRIKYAPEYEDCRKLAEANGIPLRQVFQSVENSISASHLAELSDETTQA
jgi:uncharacterized protein (DUF111 family)